ncbi:histone-lysine N-methyltransferase SETMAR [Plakobranchus ocellatus]|uniref:Histone-lysine N-methyltransferase SETMAR n=1 Tax=Plakobranchus ocellatus TaxID=259542 RepID=A0AAV3YI99_9GAST|nr:histone-lysine N-methyltransferase SETMAR [Plakobranchus ocellatus]
MEVPGKVGWPVVGDKSVEFYRDPMHFLSKHIAHTKSPIFKARFLNKPTVFVCSNQGVRDALNCTGEHLDFGYESFMKGMFGHNVLFSKDEEAEAFRQFLSKLFTNHCLEEYETVISRIVTRHISTLKITREPLCLYLFFKNLFSDVCLSLFLGLDSTENSEQANSILSLTVDHWRGIVSVPLDLRLVHAPSTYSKALQAKDHLLEMISIQKKRAKAGFPMKVKETSNLDGSIVDNHLLLFTSALLPKVLASICTCLYVEIGKSDTSYYQGRARSDDAWLEDLLKEAMRLCPPLLGGRRLASKNCLVAGYNVPKDYALVYITHFAQRDPKVFEDPDQFKPERWAQRPELKDRLYVYGFGSRCCLGERLSALMLKTTLSSLLNKFVVQVCADQDFSHKFIPVLRPRNHLMVHLRAI